MALFCGLSGLILAFPLHPCSTAREKTLASIRVLYRVTGGSARVLYQRSCRAPTQKTVTIGANAAFLALLRQE